jgi:hypothetical protein
MKQFTNFAQFKKLITLGTNVKAINHHPVLGKDFGIRKVSIVQTNSFALSTTLGDGNVVDSWLQYPKASEVIVKDNTLYIYNDEKKDKLILTYQILD